MNRRPVSGRIGGKRDLLTVGALVWALLAVSHASARDLGLYDTWRWTRFTTESGLPTDDVLDIAETPAGTVWVTTGEGLAWFDDYRWHPVTAGLPDGEIVQITSRGQDNLLVIAAQRVFEGDREGFREISLELGEPESNIVAAFPLPSGLVFLARDDVRGSSRLFRHEGGVTTPFDPPAPVIHSDKVPQLWSPASNKLWVGTEAGLFHWKAGQWSTPMAFPGTATVTARHVAGNEKGEVLVVVSRPPALRGVWQWKEGEGLSRKPGTDHLVRALDVGPAGETLVVQASGEVEIRERGGWFDLDPVPPEMKSAQSLRFRLDGSLWVATKGGLYHHDAVVPLWTQLATAETDVDNITLEILPDRDGNVWVGTARGLQIHRPDGTVERIERIRETPLEGVTGLAKDGDGNLWITSGASFEGAFQWDGSGWRHIGRAEGLPAQRIHRIEKDRAGRLWFLGMARNRDRRPGEKEPGAFVLTGDRFEPWGVEQGLPSGRIYGFAEDSKGAYWFATQGGLSRWSDGEWTHWDHDRGLKMNRVFTLAVDRDDRVWFGHQEGGLGVLEGDRPRYLTTVDGLPSDEVWDVTARDGGGIWIATQGGVCSYREQVWACFDTTTGLSNDHLWPLHAGPERLYVGTLGSGVSVLDLQADRPAPRVEIAEPIVEDQTVLLRWRALGYRGRPAPAKVETRWRVGNDPWSEWSVDREVRLEHLSAGLHEFHIQAKGLFGDFELSGARTGFTVSPPFYRRPAFLIPIVSLLIAVAFLLGILIHRRRKHEAVIRARDRHYREDLEHRVAERTAELATLNDALRVSERDLRELSRRLIRAGEEERKSLARDLHDDLNQRLAVLAMQIQRLADQPPDSPDALSRTADSLWRQTTELCDDVQRLAYQLHPSKLEELGLIPAARSFCAEIATQTGIRVRFREEDLPDSIPSDTSLCLYRVLQESLWNVARHSGAADADVELIRDAASIGLLVSDPGIGFDPDAASAQGLGLLSMRERLRLVGGELKIDSAPGRGTRIGVRVPIPTGQRPVPESSATV